MNQTCFENRCIDNSKKTVIINIMKKFLLVLALLLIPIYIQAAELPNVQLKLRDYHGIIIPQGTFIPVMNTQEISTQSCDEGYKVKFICTNDLYIHETNIIPKDTAFYGYIEKINAPIIGTNASMKIRITKMVYTDGYEIPLRGYLYTSNDNIFGGELSEPAKYIRMAQRQQKVKKTTLQVRASYERKMGTHTTIAPGSNELIIITSPLWVTHTLTN